MTTIIEDYLREVEASLRVDATRKRQIVDELRSHLSDKVAEMRAAQPERSIFEVEQEVLREFGNPRDLALAYEPDGTAVLTSAAGNIVLRVGKAVGRGAAAVGRGTGRAIKWIAVAIGVLLVISLGVGAWAYYEVKPHLAEIIESTEPVYRYYESCPDVPCSGASDADIFYVAPDARYVRFDLDVYRGHVHLDEGETREIPNGTLRIVVLDPEGAARYDRTFNATPSVSGGSYGAGGGWSGLADQELSWAPMAGNWSVQYTFHDFLGSIGVRAYAPTFTLERA